MLGKLAGYAGTLCLGACAAPLLIQTIRVGHTDLDQTFLALWLSGELLTLWHVLVEGGTTPVKLNYLANAAMVSVIGWYRWA